MNIDQILTKTAWVVFFLIGILAGSAFTVNTAFAIHETEELTWQVVMISSYPACSNYHYQIKEKYNEITSMYLDLYEQNHKGLEPLCFSHLDFYDEYEKPSEVDLLVVVYDKNGGRDKLQSIGIGGIFAHMGGEWTHNNTIIICDCPNFGFSDPVWTLTHELSHFLLYYLGYPEEIAQDHIHEIDRKYDDCVEVEHSPECYGVKTKIRTQYYSYNWNVMKPYAPAIGKDPIQNTLSSKQKSILDSEMRLDIAKEITGWWQKGIIDDSAYSKAMKILVNRMGMEQRPFTSNYSADAKNMITADAGDKIPDNQLDEIENLDLDSRVAGLIFDSQPFLKDNLNEESDNEVNYEIPSWFKTRAKWWVSGNITNYDFVSGINYVAPEELKVELSSPEILLDSENNIESIEDSAPPRAQNELDIKIIQGRSSTIDCSNRRPVDITFYAQDSQTRLYSLDLSKIMFSDSGRTLSVANSILLSDGNRDKVFDATLTIRSSTFCQEVLENNEGISDYSPINLTVVTDTGAFFGNADFKLKNFQ